MVVGVVVGRGVTKGYNQFVEEHSSSPPAWHDNLLPLLRHKAAQVFH